MACMGDRIGAYWIWCGGLAERDHLEDLSIKGRILLKWNFRSGIGKHGLH